MSLTKVKAGNILLTTPSASSNDVTPATTQYVTTAIGNLVDTAPSTLNTLNELAAALGDDVNFSTTVTNSIATKLPLAGGTMTGTLTVAGSSSGTVDALIITNTDTTNNGLSIGVDSSENAFFWNGSNTSMNFATNNTLKMVIDASGNVGIGTTPSTGWVNSTDFAALQIGSGLALWGRGSGDHERLGLTANIYHDGSAYKHIHTGRVTAYEQNDGKHVFKYYASQAAGTSVTPTTAMMIDTSGNVGIGTSNPLNKFVVAHESHGVAIDYVGATLPYQAGLFTSSSALTQTAYGDLNIKSRSDYTTYGIGFFTANVANTPTLRMKIAANGNVGIGNSGASSLYWPNGSTGGLFLQAGGLLSAYNAGTNLSQNWYYNSGEKFIGNGGASRYVQAGQVHIWSHSTAVNSSGAGAGLTWSESMRIDSSGNMLVGTTSAGTQAAGGVAIVPSTDSLIRVGHANGTGSGSKYMQFSYNQSELGSITQHGTSQVLFNVSSDQRLKENIADADDAGSKIDAIQVRSFDWKADGLHQDYGMIAQELQAVVPEAVSGSADSEEMMGVDYSKLVPMLIKEIQLLRQRVAQLEE